MRSFYLPQPIKNSNTARMIIAEFESHNDKVNFFLSKRDLFWSAHRQGYVTLWFFFTTIKKKKKVQEKKEGEGGGKIQYLCLKYGFLWFVGLGKENNTFLVNFTPFSIYFKYCIGWYKLKFGMRSSSIGNNSVLIQSCPIRRIMIWKFKSKDFMKSISWFHFVLENLILLRFWEEYKCD